MKRHGFHTLAFAVLLAAASVSATDEDGSPIVTEAMNPKLKSPITLWAKDANLSEVLKVLAERSEMNFVAGEGVHRERITIILNKTPLDEAINLWYVRQACRTRSSATRCLLPSPGN